MIWPPFIIKFQNFLKASIIKLNHRFNYNNALKELKTS